MPRIYLWQKAPSLRLLISLITGISMQWYLQLPLNFSLFLSITGAALVLLYRYLSITKKYQYKVLNGLGIFILFTAVGNIITFTNNIKNNQQWFGHFYKPDNIVVVTLQEPLVEKANSYKAEAIVSYIKNGKTLLPVKGKIIIYFKKDSTYPNLDYASELVIKTPLQEIKNGGNPGGFDYKRFALFEGITHQVYLNTNGFEITGNSNDNFLDAFLVKSRKAVLNILRTYITSPKEQGLAEALLIGYKDNLDKELVEAYSNTGVVHVIAISGLHLGIIYAILMWLTRPLKRKHLSFLRFCIIVICLWLFSLLAGAQPSVLRSAVMFTTIAGSTVFSRKSSIYNTIAFSALLLLCYNPFWLWDVGFQLSYAAVLSIIIFYRPIYILFPVHNKIVDFFWKLISVSIAAQILTMPVSVYHFHQFPLLFIFTNFVTVPLSSLILIGEILLCAVFFITPLAKVLGITLQSLIGLMNSYIENFENLDFAIWDSLSITVIQTIILYIFIACIGHWLLEKNKKALLYSTVFFLIFMVLRTASFIKASDQKKLIVYNVPKNKAVDLITGRGYVFIGSEALLQNNFLRNFHLKPSRIAHRISQVDYLANPRSLQFFGKRLLFIDTTLIFHKKEIKEDVDVLILSKNPKLYITHLMETFNVKQIVIDGSVPAWKARLWIKDCDSLKIPCHDVSVKGAFVMNIE